MRLSERIYALRDAVCKGESVADIGTDHGYVPMLLMRDGISPYVVMSDISEDSLSKAVETFNTVGIPAEDSQFRVGDGITTIAAGEVDDVIIAGLGGYTIRNILDEDINKSKSFNKLILQPRKHSGALRVWLYRNGYNITDEILTAEGKFICEIIVAVPTDETRNVLPMGEDDIRWAYPSTLRKANPDYLKKRVGWKLGSIEEQIVNLKKSGNNWSSLLLQLESEHRYLSELIGEKPRDLLRNEEA